MNEFGRTLPMMLYRALHNVLPAFRQIFKEFGITEQQWRILRALWENDGQALLTLSDITLISGPSIVGVVDRLERDKLVQRKRSSADRRIVHVHLTRKGRTLQQQVQPRIDDSYAELNRCMDQDAWRALYAALDILATHSLPAEQAHEDTTA